MMDRIQTPVLREGERLDDLQRGGLQIIQNPKWFCFGIDAVLLSAFTQTKKNSVVADLGTGTGIIPLLLSLRSKGLFIHAFEIQSDVAEMAQRSVLANQLDNQIKIHAQDFQSAPALLGKGSCDVVVSNPPYMEAQEGMHNVMPQKAISRHELVMSLQGLFQTAHDLLKPGGSFFMIHRPSRMVDIFTVARDHRMEPKILQFIQPAAGKKSNLMLVRFNKHGKRELKLIDPIIVYSDNGHYTDQIYDIYKGVHIDVFEPLTEDTK